MKRSLLLAIPVACAATGAVADAERYSFDSVHSQIIFFASHVGFTMSEGEFTEFSGTVTFDQDAPENSSVEVTIDTTSLDMDHEPWDAHMKSADFFDVESHPTATFASTRVNVTGDATGTITGDLTLLGQTRPVTLDVTFNKAGEFRDSYRAGFSATASLKRSDWGMNFGIPAVGEDVDLRIEAELVRQ